MLTNAPHRTDATRPSTTLYPASFPVSITLDSPHPGQDSGFPSLAKKHTDRCCVNTHTRHQVRMPRNFPATRNQHIFQQTTANEVGGLIRLIIISRTQPLERGSIDGKGGNVETEKGKARNNIRNNRREVLSCSYRRHTGSVRLLSPCLPIVMTVAVC